MSRHIGAEVEAASESSGGEALQRGVAVVMTGLSAVVRSCDESKRKAWREAQSSLREPSSARRCDGRLASCVLKDQT